MNAKISIIIKSFDIKNLKKKDKRPNFNGPPLLMDKQPPHNIAGLEARVRSTSDFRSARPAKGRQRINAARRHSLAVACPSDPFEDKRPPHNIGSVEKSRLRMLSTSKNPNHLALVRRPPGSTRLGSAVGLGVAYDKAQLQASLVNQTVIKDETLVDVKNIVLEDPLRSPEEDIGSKKALSALKVKEPKTERRPLPVACSYAPRLCFVLPRYLHSIRLPKTRTLYTVLRSPHIDKKSREQFEMKIHKQCFFIQSEIKYLRTQLLLLKLQDIPGVQCKIVVNYKTRLGILSA